MANYSIKDLEQLSGIKAHTIRIWEKRHQIIRPQRTATNIRYYSDDDLKKIINVSLLNTSGIKISRIACMSAPEVAQKVIELSEQRDAAHMQIDRLVMAMVDLEEDVFEKILSGMILRFGFERVITEIVYPFLEKIGILWQTRHITPAHEHFISNLIRQKIIVAIDSLPAVAAGGERAVLFLPERELHELALLFFNYLMRKAGYRTFYFGQNLPHEDLKSVYQTHRPQLLVTYITTPPPDGSIDRYLKRLHLDFPDSRILVSGVQVARLEKSPFANITFFKNAADIKDLLTPRVKSAP
ncbi:MAG: MerR family transcriptional regulator [Bacteroidia bacterium]|nr:MerR family transcriptional regulator [Bacteroidia bacterium]